MSLKLYIQGKHFNATFLATFAIIGDKHFSKFIADYKINHICFIMGLGLQLF